MWSDTWYPQAIAALITLRGPGPKSLAGNDLPNLTAMDTIGVISQVAGPLARSFSRACGSIQGKEVVTVGIPDEDGYVSLLDAQIASSPGGVGLSMISGATFLSSAQYLAGPGTALAESWKRYAPQQASALAGDPYQERSGPMFEPYQVNGETALLQMVRQSVTEWQRLCDASAMAISVSAADVSQAMGQDEAREFFSALAALCGSLDVIGENPPVVGSIGGALRAAVDATQEFVGKSVAQLSEEVGRLAGNLASGFLQNIGLLGLAVAGIAIFIALR